MNATLETTSGLTGEDLQSLSRQLTQRRTDLRAELRAELLASDNERYQRIAGEVHDRGDESVADLLADVDHALVGRHILQLREIRAAEDRMHNGTYGICVKCGTAIGYARLRAQPTAQRCRYCQERYEERIGMHEYPRL